MTLPVQWPDQAEDMPPERERSLEMDDAEIAARIAYCRDRGLDPFALVADGGVEAWMAVTEHNLILARIANEPDARRREAMWKEIGP